MDRFLALVEGVDVLLPSRDEACLLTGLPDPADAAAKLSRHVPLVVAKQGADGALVARAGTVRAAGPGRARDAPGHHGRRRRLHRARSSPPCSRAPEPEEAAVEGCAGGGAGGGAGGRKAADAD